MEAKLKEVLPQEGTSSNAGESLPESSTLLLAHGCPTYSGGGNVLPQMELDDSGVRKETTKTKKLVQQAFHPGLFVNRTRSMSLTTSRTNILDEALADNPSQNRDNHSEKRNPPNWQRVPVPRNPKRKKLSESPPPIATTNRYGELPVDLTEDGENDPPPRKIVKPPPIVLYGIEDVNKLTELLKTVAETEDFTYKIVNRNQLRVSSTTTETYKRLTELVREHGLIGHTFNRKDKRNYRLVIKNLHPTTPVSAIKEEIELTGNSVVGEIINFKYGPEKKPSSTFFVNLLAGPENKAVKDLKYIYHQSVTIEDPRKRKYIAQCQRCQQYGHTKNYCMRPFRCVKCAQQHKTSECPKRDRSTPALCALCQGPHPANYKGCEVYRQISLRKSHTHKQQVVEKAKIPETIIPGFSISPAKENKQDNELRQSYAEKTRAAMTKDNTSNSSLEKPQTTDDIKELLLKQTEKFDLLLQQMSTMIGLMTTLINKMSQ